MQDDSILVDSVVIILFVTFFPISLFWYESFFQALRNIEKIYKNKE